MKPNHHLKYERELKGWSQQEVAQRIGTTALSVSRWERGITAPTTHFRSQLCTLFGKDAQELGLIEAHDDDDLKCQQIHLPDQHDFSPSPVLDPAIPSSVLQASALVGRESVFQVLKQHLLTHTGSLAISGLPGVGKTALALALTADETIRAQFRDGILWAGLGPEPDTFRLLSRWGVLLGLAPSEMAQVMSLDLFAMMLRDVIGHRRLLLVLDDAWEIKTALMFKIGGMRCMHLVTTRFPPLALQFAGEEATTPIHELPEEESVTLLRRLAPAVVTRAPGNRDIELHELVRSVGGLPLALTLMGKYLQLQAHGGQPRRISAALTLLHHIDRRLHLTAEQAFSERSPSLSAEAPLSLEAVIEVSELVLDQRARAALRALSVFPAKPNSFSECAALTVCACSEEELDHLTDAGLLESAGPGRYTLHQTIADYARLHRSDPSVEARMVHFFVSFLEASQQDYELLDQEANNIVAAFDLAAQKGLLCELQQGVNLFAPFLEDRGLYALAEKYLEQAQQAARSSGDEKGLALTLFYLGRLTGLRGDLPSAERIYQEGLSTARRAACSETLSYLLAHSGSVAMHRGEYDRAELLLTEGLIVARELKQQRCMGFILWHLGEIACYRGNIREGRGLYLQGLELARRSDDWETMGALLQNLGVLAEWSGKYEQARDYYQEGMTSAQKRRDWQRISMLLMNMGMLAFRQHCYQEAEKHYKEALELARKIEHRRIESMVLQNLGMLERVRRNYTQAQCYLQDSLNIARETKHDWLIHETLNEVGELALSQGKMEEAAAIFQEVQTKAEAMGEKELIAAALYGLARVDAANHNNVEAYEKGSASQQMFEHMDFEKGKQIAQWLTTLSREKIIKS